MEEKLRLNILELTDGLWTDQDLLARPGRKHGLWTISDIPGGIVKIYACQFRRLHIAFKAHDHVKEDVDE